MASPLYMYFLFWQTQGFFFAVFGQKAHRFANLKSPPSSREIMAPQTNWFWPKFQGK
jgi:hypothetical protein